jgi:sulfur-oxidizing protein SoxZ
MSTPKPRIKLDKKEAKKGDIVEVKALVSHVM